MKMDCRKVMLISLACLIGKIQTVTILEDKCGDNFLKSLKEANFGRWLKNGTLGVTLNLKYLSKKGESLTATIKLSDHCSVPQVICEGEKVEVNGEMKEGPLLQCTWKWKPEDVTWNKVEIGLTEDIEEMRAVSIIGRLSKMEEVFPDAANDGPLDFKIITSNGSGVLHRKRRRKAHRRVSRISGYRKRKKSHGITKYLD